MEFGTYIKEQCQIKGMSLYQLSKLSGVRATTISSYVNHGIQPTIGKADALLRALGVTMTLGKEQNP